MIGLEVHIQLNTGKLFCRCPVDGGTSSVREIRRRLKPTIGESGMVDRAAMYEELRDRTFTYSLPDNTCLVDCDEEPPRQINTDALDTALKVSSELNCSLFEAIECMRKIVIDGSNTSGFQRTALVATGGYVETSKGRVGISSVCLEEDSAKKLNDKSEDVRYSLGRLGIPLIEVATDPDIKDAAHAMEVAKIIGMSAIVTGMVRHEAESIRQDVNFSMGHGRVEIKGVSRISQIEEAINSETERQKMLENASATIEKRGGFHAKNFVFTDITEKMKNSGSKIISNGIKAGNRIFCARLENMRETLKHDDLRMGQELADLARAYSIGGILHSDELPGYGITEAEKSDLELVSNAGSEDGFVCIVTSREKAAILEREFPARIKKLVSLDLPETRFLNSSGRTAYLRPLPGSERMYPETDLQTIRPGPSSLDEAKEFGKKSPEDHIASIANDYGISVQDAGTIVTGLKLDLFRQLSKHLNARYAARFVLQIQPEIERKNSISMGRQDLLEIAEGIRKKGLPDLSFGVAIEALSNGRNVHSILSSPDIIPMDEGEIASLVRELKASGSNVTAKSVVPRLKEKTKRPFDAKTAMDIAASLL